MKKILSLILIIALCFALFAGCKAEPEIEENNANIIYPLPETIDISNLDNCSVAAALSEGDAYVGDDGKMVMKLTVYGYELYDMVDIASLEEGSIIVRGGEEVSVTELERLDTGIIRINGGEGNGGFDLASSDSTVYYEVGPNDLKAYYEIGEVTLPVSDEFEYIDESEIGAEAKILYAGDFLIADADIEYNFSPNNTSVVIENGNIIKMNKVYMP